MKKALASVLFALLCLQALAEYPSKPIQLINPFPAGGVGNNLGRILADGLAEKLKVPVYVDSRGGANGIVGGNVAKAAAADGHTLLLGTISTLSLAPLLYESFPFDTVKDFDPIAMTFVGTNVLVVNSASPITTLAQLAPAARKAPNGLTYATTGIGTTAHLLGGMFGTITGAQMIPVPYRGNAPAVTAMLSNECDVFFGAMADVLPHILSGKLRPLAVTSPQRFANLPNVPTTAEAGLPGLVLEAWFGLVVPAGTPGPVVEKLNAAVGEVLASDKVKAQVRGMNMDIARNSSSKHFGEQIKSEMIRWKPVVKQAGIKAD